MEEFLHYLAYFEGSMVLSTGIDLSAFKETKGLDVIIHEFENRHPEFRYRTQVTTFHIDYYSAKIAYCTFLNIAYWFLEALEKKRMPFVFTLYPGGGFEMNEATSDGKLRRVLGSTQFRKVIVTQQITYEYLLRKHFAPQIRLSSSMVALCRQMY